MKTLLSGIQPSGDLHIGNYLGAIKQWVNLQDDYREFIAIVDLHAITVPQEPERLREKTLEVAALLLACGIDPKKSALFVQSHVPAHTELAWILNTLTPVGELERMTQYKDKSQKIKDKSGTLAGLLNYPVLQAADILLYHPDVVPIGEDQQQHLELTRTLARKFNNKFGDTFKEPKALINTNAKRIMGLDNPGVKMSKSASSSNNYISLLDTEDEIRRKIKIAVTDSESAIGYDEAKRPAVSNLLNIYSAFSGTPATEIVKKYSSKGYAEFKSDLGELLVEKLSPIREKYVKLSKDKKKLLAILKSGAEEASEVANKTLSVVKERIGLVL